MGPPPQDLAAQPHRPSQALARRVAWTGAGLALLDAAALLWLWMRSPRELVAVTTSMGMLFAAGKEAAIPFGVFVAHGMPALVGFFVWLTDIAAVALAYPLVHSGLDAVERSRIGGLLRTARRRAESKRKLVDRLGPAGLFLFLIVPFAFNSPIVGLVLGRVAGLRPRSTVFVVLAAVTATDIAWTVLSAYGRGLPATYAWIPLTLSLTVTTLVLGSSLVAWLRDRSRARSGAQ